MTAGLRRRTVFPVWKPIDIASLVFFRVAFGIVCFCHVWLQVPTIGIEYVKARMHFTYFGFDWVRSLPGELMHLPFFVMAAAAILIAAGLWYRAAVIAFFVTHTYVFLIDQVGYWNHYYLISLLAFLMIFVPANRAYSLDVMLGRVKQSDYAPAGALWILRAQIGLTYFFAGLAKLNGDWLGGKPMDSYLLAEQDFPLIGRWFTEEWLVMLFSYGGTLFDLLIVPFLLWRVTRIPALILAIGFHLANAMIFNIQVFPWLAIVATSLFLAPDWPRLGGQWPMRSPLPGEGAQEFASAPRARRVGLTLLGMYFLVQLLLPLRHYAIPGNVDWTSEGYLFSWRMLVAEKEGSIRFFVAQDSSDVSCEIDLAQHMDNVQAGKLAQRPDMMIQFAHRIHDSWQARGKDVRVHAWSDLALNGRSPRAIVNPEADLASVKRGIGHYSFLTDVNSAEQLVPPSVGKCEPTP